MGQRKLEDPNIEGFKIVSNMAKYFWNSREGKFVNGTGGTGDFNGDFMVWPASIAVQAVIDAARINKNYVGLLNETVPTLDKYFSHKTKGFAPTMGGQDEFYADDSAQAVICYITAYEVTGNKRYLDTAVEGVQFLMGMEDSKVHGGVRWKTGQPGANAVSTAESGMAAALLAKYVKQNEIYLKFGDYCYQFLQNKMLDSDGLIADGLEGDKAELNHTKWTYNQGTPLTLYSLMYSHTKDEKYFKAAHALASAASDTNSPIFDRDTQDHNVRFYQDGLNFYLYLAQGFADYLLYFGDRDQELSQRIVNVVNRQLYYVYEFMVFPNEDAMYSGTLKIWNLDKARNEAFNKMTGENKPLDIDAGERKGGKANNDFAGNLMNIAAAARTFFQSARVVPHVSF